MYISYNKYQVYGKVVILFTIFSLFGLFVLFHPPLPELHFTFLTVFIISIAVIICSFLVLMIIQLLFFPKAIEINKLAKTLTVHYFILRPNLIYSTDMLEYTTTELVTKSTRYEGILVHTKGGRKYLFDDVNISDYRPIKTFLEDIKIPFSGHEIFSNVSYFVSFFKYKLYAHNF
jgi:hypothetical protein